MIFPSKISAFNYLIGIDPGRQTGVAVTYIKNKVQKLELKTFTFETENDVNNLTTFIEGYPKDSTKIVVEQPSQLTFIYGKHHGDKNRAVLNKIAQDVGRNKMIAQMIANTLRFKGYFVAEVKPRKAKKMDRKTFTQITNYQKSNNQHQRDAAMLIWGYQPKPLTDG